MTNGIKDEGLQVTVPSPSNVDNCRFKAEILAEDKKDGGRFNVFPASLILQCYVDTIPVPEQEQTTHS